MWIKLRKEVQYHNIEISSKFFSKEFIQTEFVNKRDKTTLS